MERKKNVPNQITENKREQKFFEILDISAVKTGKSNQV